MKKAAIFPNTVTAFGLICGLFVIFRINILEPGSGDYEVILVSTILLLIATLADFFDGALARAIHGESEFGFVFDSLSDAICFGVAPSVLMLKTLSMEPGTFLSFLCSTGAMVFSLCGVLRLVRFSVKAKEVEGNLELQEIEKKHFTGLPIPAGAIAAVSANLLFLSPHFRKFFDLEMDTRAIILATLMIVLGYLMVCRLKFPSLKMLKVKIPSFHKAFGIVVAAVFLIYGLIYFFAIVLAIGSWAYIIVSLVLSLIRFFAGKKSKTLEEFEPEEDEDL